MSTHHCEECWAVLDPAKVLRCTKCKACFYCSAACQKRNWRLHKRVCSTDPLLRRFVPVEMAVQRALTKLPPMEKAPKDARCYICLEGDGALASSKLLRGCACRGDSAGYVHLECLTKLAESKDESGDVQIVFTGWTKCGNCKQRFTGALALEMTRRFWRRHRSSQDLELFYNSTKFLVVNLKNNAEIDAANQLLDEASKCIGNDNKHMLLELKLLRADMVRKNGQMLEALGFLQAMLPEAKQSPPETAIYFRTLLQIVEVLLNVDRNREAHEAATEAVAYAKANYSLEHPRTMSAMKMYALACAGLGRVEETKANFEDVLATEIRVLGREHPYTQITVADMRKFGFAVPSG